MLAASGCEIRRTTNDLEFCLHCRLGEGHHPTEKRLHRLSHDLQSTSSLLEANYDTLGRLTIKTNYISIALDTKTTVITDQVMTQWQQTHEAICKDANSQISSVQQRSPQLEFRNDRLASSIDTL